MLEHGDTSSMLEHNHCHVRRLTIVANDVRSMSMIDRVARRHLETTAVYGFMSNDR
jgi:hypothetical protein